MTGYHTGYLLDKQRQNAKEVVEGQNRRCYQSRIQDILFPKKNPNYTDVSVWVARDPDDNKVADGWYFPPVFNNTRYDLDGESRTESLLKRFQFYNYFFFQTGLSKQGVKETAQKYK